MAQDSERRRGAMMYADVHADWGRRDTIIIPDLDSGNIGTTHSK